jgi:hypothetical protein
MLYGVGVRAGALPHLTDRLAASMCRGCRSSSTSASGRKSCRKSAEVRTQFGRNVPADDISLASGPGRGSKAPAASWRAKRRRCGSAGRNAVRGGCFAERVRQAVLIEHKPHRARSAPPARGGSGGTAPAEWLPRRLFRATRPAPCSPGIHAEGVVGRAKGNQAKHRRNGQGVGTGPSSACSSQLGQDLRSAALARAWAGRAEGARASRASMTAAASGGRSGRCVRMGSGGRAMRARSKSPPLGASWGIRPVRTSSSITPAE